MSYFELLKNILQYGRVIGTKPDSENINRREMIKELIDVKLEFGCYNYIATKSARPVEKTSAYFKGELPWYMSGDRKNCHILPYSRFWEKIQNPDGTANSNYGWLVFHLRRGGLTAYEFALKSLEADPNSRQAIVLYNDRMFNVPESKDYICSQYQHFLIRENTLFCIVGLRSSDAIFGLQYNMPWWSIVHQRMRIDLLHKYPKLKLGKISVNISSAHLYKKHFDLANAILHDKPENKFVKLLKPWPYCRGFEFYRDNLDEFVSMRSVL